MVNPYELGRSHAEQGLKSQNPFEEFGGKWCQYNMGYNSILFKKLGLG